MIHSAIPDSQQPIAPIGFLYFKLPPPPCAVLLVMVNEELDNHQNRKTRPRDENHQTWNEVGTPVLQPLIQIKLLAQMMYCCS